MTTAPAPSATPTLRALQTVPILRSRAGTVARAEGA
jgi:hypothetical protein